MREGLQLFGSAMCSPNAAPVNEGWSAAACRQTRGFAPRCQSACCRFDEDSKRQPASVPSFGCNSTGAQMTMKPQAMDQSQGHGYGSL